MRILCSLIAAVLASTSVAADDEGDDRTNYFYAYPQAVCPDPAYGLAEVRECVANYIAGANRDLFRVERSMQQVRWRNDELVRHIRDSQTGNQVAPDLYGGTNLDYPEYPKPACIEPVSESEMVEHDRCVKQYLEAADNDYERIRHKLMDARRHRPSKNQTEEPYGGTPFKDRQYGSSNHYDPRYPLPDCPGPEGPEYKECIAKYIDAATADRDRVAQSIYLAKWRYDEMLRTMRGIDVQEQLSRGPFRTSNLDHVEYPDPGCPEPADEHDLFEYHDCIRSYLEAAENDIERLEEAMSAARRLRIQAEKAYGVIR